MRAAYQESWCARNSDCFGRERPVQRARHRLRSRVVSPRSRIAKSQFQVRPAVRQRNDWCSRGSDTLTEKTLDRLVAEAQRQAAIVRVLSLMRAGKLQALVRHEHVSSRDLAPSAIGFHAERSSLDKTDGVRGGPFPVGIAMGHVGVVFKPLEADAFRSNERGDAIHVSNSRRKRPSSFCRPSQ
jgi:hypothetical protein